MIHGDDITLLGQERSLDWLRQAINIKFEVKASRIVPAEGDGKSFKLFNRVIEWTAEGIVSEGDQRHLN